jgi:hypothetical protein
MSFDRAPSSETVSSLSNAAMAHLVKAPNSSCLKLVNVDKEYVESYLIENHKFDRHVDCINLHAVARFCAEDSGLISHELPLADKKRSTA